MPTLRFAGGSLAVVAALMVLSGAWIWPLGGVARDLFAAHMLQHMLAMNVAALLIAMVLESHSRGGLAALAVFTVLQLAGLWIWHMPAVFAAAHHNPALDGLMKVSLFAAALLFWSTVLGRRDQSVWPPIFALLITAKVFCLLGAAFVFSRRTLYPAFGNPERWGLTVLEDQQLAGLLMVSSCALIYVAAAITLFTQWLFTTETRVRDRFQVASDAALLAR